MTNASASVGEVSLRVGDGMKVEAVNLEVTESQEEPKRRSATRSSSLSVVAAAGDEVGGGWQPTAVVAVTAEAQHLLGRWAELSSWRPTMTARTTATTMAMT